jgi:hypothetical protein
VGGSVLRQGFPTRMAILAGISTNELKMLNLLDLQLFNQGKG